MRGLSLVVASGDHSSSRCAGLSLSRTLLLRSRGSTRAGSAIVAYGPSRSVACGNLPRPGLEPVSPALAGRLSTTAPPGKPPVEGFNRKRLTFWEREFCQQSAFRLKLQLFPGSLACWPTLHILDLPSLCNRVSRFLKVTQPFSLYLSLNLSLQDVCPTHMYILFCFSQEP